MNQKQPSPTIGIVSGVGPLAGSDVLAKIYKNAAYIHKAVEDHEYPDVHLLNHGIKGVDNTGKLCDNFETEIIEMTKKLEKHGATVIGIACNTAHLYLNKIQLKETTKLVNLIDCVAHKASQVQCNYLLLTSDTSKKHKLYHKYLIKYGVIFSETTDKQQVLLDKAIAKIMGHNLVCAGELIKKVLKQAKSDGFTAVIAACTELPIAIDSCNDVFGLYIIDSNDVLSQTLLNIYYKDKNNLN